MKFINQKNIKLTIKNDGKEKITTLFSHEAKPLVAVSYTHQTLPTNREV